MKVLRDFETSVEEGVEKMFVDRYRYRGGVKEQFTRYLIIISIDPAGVKKLSRR